VIAAERINDRAGQIGFQQHVGFLNTLPASDRGSVKHNAFIQQGFINRADSLIGMLPFAGRVDETKADILHAMLFDH
jgi:hypothetical protein